MGCVCHAKSRGGRVKRSSKSSRSRRSASNSAGGVPPWGPLLVFTVGGLSRLSGKIADRIGPRIPLTVGPLVAAAGFALLALLPAQYTHLKWGSGGSEAVESTLKLAQAADAILFGAVGVDPRGMAQRGEKYLQSTGLADTAVFGASPATKCGLEFFPVDKIVFASDCPFDPEKGTMYTRETLRIIDGIDMPKADKEKIWHGNLEAITGVKFRS